MTARPSHPMEETMLESQQSQMQMVWPSGLTDPGTHPQGRSPVPEARSLPAPALGHALARLSRLLRRLAPHLDQRCSAGKEGPLQDGACRSCC